MTFMPTRRNGLRSLHLSVLKWWRSNGSFWKHALIINIIKCLFFLDLQPTRDIFVNTTKFKRYKIGWRFKNCWLLEFFRNDFETKMGWNWLDRYFGNVTVSFYFFFIKLSFLIFCQKFMFTPPMELISRMVAGEIKSWENRVKPSTNLETQLHKALHIPCMLRRVSSAKLDLLQVHLV
jgi:hypothetical protein